MSELFGIISFAMFAFLLFAWLWGILHEPDYKTLQRRAMITLILSILKQGELDTYNLMKAIRDAYPKSEGFQGQFYPTLWLMEDKELIASRTETGKDGHLRQFYSLSSTAKLLTLKAIEKLDL